MKLKKLYSFLIAVLVGASSNISAQKIDAFKYESQKKVNCSKGAVASAMPVAPTPPGAAPTAGLNK